MTFYAQGDPAAFDRERAIFPENWGLFLPAVQALSLLGLAARRGWQRPVILSLFFLSVIVAALQVLICYVRACAPWANLQAILRRDSDRAFLPGFFMLRVTAVLAATDRRGRQLSWSWRWDRRLSWPGAGM